MGLRKQTPREREVRQFLKKLSTGGVGFLLARLLIAAAQSSRNHGDHDTPAAWEPIVAALNLTPASHQPNRGTITGDDLIALGTKPVPRFRALLNRAGELAGAGKARENILNVSKHQFLI